MTGTPMRTAGSRLLGWRLGSPSTVASRGVTGGSMQKPPRQFCGTPIAMGQSELFVQEVDVIEPVTLWLAVTYRRGVTRNPVAVVVFAFPVPWSFTMTLDVREGVSGAPPVIADALAPTNSGL